MISFLRHGLFYMLFLSVMTMFSAFVGAQTTTAGLNVTSVNVYGVTSSNQLIRFNSSSPANVTTVGAISGLQSETVLGIDFRPATGELFALTTGNRLYVIDKNTAAASAPRSLSVALAGTSFGVDFNPTVDRLRIVSNTGQNLRVDPSNGVAITDGVLNGGATGAEAAAYTNSFNGATATTLYDISSTTDTLYTQNPPNNGTLVAVGAIGVDVNAINGFDIFSGDSTALAALTTGTASNLYTINLTTGAASLLGPIGGGQTSLVGFAIETAATSNFVVYGLTTGNNLIRFNSSRPNTILSSIPITGLQGGENLQGIDFRPATGQLFGLGNSRIYTIDTRTGAATLVGGLTTPLLGTNFGFDFNPVPDRIRITSDLDQNLRANPNDGTNLVDGVLAYATGDPNFGQNPAVVASAYTNSFAGSTTTTLYNIDQATGSLVIQNPPNNGTLNTVGRLGLSVTGDAGFDINPGNNTALASLQVQGGSGSALYAINLTNGSAAIIGPIGGGAVVRGIAIARASANSVSNVLDFDGDGRTDEVVFRLSNNTWFIRNSSNGSVRTQVWGTATDFFVPGDYDGDGRTDIAVWRPSNGVFYIIQSSNNVIVTRQFGAPGDEPVARDYDGDGRTDYAVVRRSGGVMTWYIQTQTEFRVREFGVESDIVAPGDYEGDGRFDLAVRRGSGNQPAVFYVLQSSGGFIVYPPFGVGSDLVVPGDYDGDGRTDLTALRQGSTYTWFVRSASGFFAAELGNKPDFSVQGDYDGDGRTDIAVWQPIFGSFAYFRSSNGALVQTLFGMNGDYPVANYDTH